MADRPDRRYRWPREIEDAIAAGLSAGLGPVEIHRQIKTGRLPGLRRAYRLPERTFYSLLRSARERVAGPPSWERPDFPRRPGEGFIEYLARESEQPGYVLHRTADGSPCTCGDPVCVEHGGLMPGRDQAASEGPSKAQKTREAAIAHLRAVG